MILHNLRLLRNGKPLIRDGILPLKPGSITVLFGPSGSGKSTLLYALGDLDPSLELMTEEGTAPLQREHVGLVPQQAAVFEDLGTAAKNIAFAHDHVAGTRKQDVKAALQQAKANLGVERTWRFPLSGGQKQRIAIARALAGKATILLCDEPTSGLDPASRQDAINAIREAAREGVAVLVVTHDQEWNHTEAADHAVILRDGVLTAHTVGQALDRAIFAASTQATTANPGFNRALLNFFERFGVLAWWLLLFPLQIGRGLFGKNRVSGRWLLSNIIHFGRLTLGISSLVYLGAGGALVGFASLYFSVGALAIQSHMQQILKPELLSGSGFGLYRVIIPLITALLVSAKTGSAIAADIGARQYGGQIAVMRTLRANPETHLLFSIILALAIGMPLLNILAFVAASAGSLAAYLISAPGETAYAWSVDFLRLLQTDGGNWWLKGTGWNLAKLAFSGIGVGVITYRCGIRQKSSHTDIGRDISGASLWTSLWCLAVFTVFAFFEF